MCWVPGPLQSNGDLAPVFVDRSYAADRRVAAGYFQAWRLQFVGMLRSAHLPVYPVHRLCIHKQPHCCLLFFLGWWLATTVRQDHVEPAST